MLQAGPVSPSARQALDAELALHDTMEGYNWALRSERSFSLSSVREFPGSGFWLTRGFANELALGLIDLFDLLAFVHLTRCIHHGSLHSRITLSTARRQRRPAWSLQAWSRAG